jgi:hypothetical protein
MNTNTGIEQIPESLHRYLDGEMPGALQPCRAFNCPSVTASGGYCPRCQEEIDALRAMRIKREARIAARDAKRAARAKTFFYRGKDRRAPEFDYYVLTNRWPKGPRLLIYPRLWWQRVMRFSPSDGQLGSVCAWLQDAGAVAGAVLKVAVILAALYLLLEVGSAFLPGGPVERILRGGQ